MTFNVGDIIYRREYTVGNTLSYYYLFSLVEEVDYDTQIYHLLRIYKKYGPAQETRNNQNRITSITTPILSLDFDSQSNLHEEVDIDTVEIDYILYQNQPLSEFESFEGGGEPEEGAENNQVVLEVVFEENEEGEY